MFTVLKSVLSSYSRISVMPLDIIKGAGIAMEFTDVSKNNIKELGFSEDAPSYRGVCKGINIFGDCHCKKCLAYKKGGYNTF